MANKVMVIGLGRMGSALAATLLKNNYEVSVWNRTASKATRLVEAGASQADSIAEGINVSEVILVCVSNYEDTRSLLEDCGDLSGKTLIQLTSAWSPEAAEMEAWTIKNGGSYLDGTIMAFPSAVGTKACMLLVAGSQVAWWACEHIIMCLGGASRFIGENVEAPAALEAALVMPEVFATLGMIQGVLVIEKEGLDVGEYVKMVADLSAEDGGGELRRQGNAIVRNDFSDTEATLGVYAAGFSKFLEGHAERGFNVEFAQAISGLLDRASSAGYEEEEVSAVIKVMRE